MKRFFAIAFLIVLTACSTPTLQATVTSIPPTATETPAPPTLTPTLSVEVFTSQYGLKVEILGPADENGMQKVNILPPEKYADRPDVQAKWLKYFDAERLGFDPGATEWVLAEDGRTVLVDTSDHSKIIAEWKEIDWIGKAAIVWNWANFVEADRENPLFDVCKVWELTRKGGSIVDDGGFMDFNYVLIGREEAIIRNGSDLMYGSNERLISASQSGEIFANDGKSFVATRFMKSPSVKGEGFIFTRDNEGNSILLFTENNNWSSLVNRPK